MCDHADPCEEWNLQPWTLQGHRGHPVINPKSVLKISFYIHQPYIYLWPLPIFQTAFIWGVWPKTILPSASSVLEPNSWWFQGHMQIIVKICFTTGIRKRLRILESLPHTWMLSFCLTCPILPGVHKGISTHAETLGGIKNAQVQLGLCSWCWEWYMWGTGKPRPKPRIAKPCYLCCFKLRFTMTQTHGENSSHLPAHMVHKLTPFRCSFCRRVEAWEV